MTTKQVLFRLDDNKLIALDKKLSDKGISKQFFLSKCVELFLEDKLSFDNNVITNDSSEIASIKKQLAIINERLSNLENDNKVIAFDKTVTNTELDNNDRSVIATDNFLIQSSEPVVGEKTESNLVDNILTAVKQKHDITEKNTLSESPILPLSEVSPQMIPETEKQENKLNKRESEVLSAMKNVESGTVFTSQSKLIQFLGFDKSDSAVVTKLKPFWENKLFSVKPVGNSNELTRL